MVRAALAGRRRPGQGPVRLAAYIPAVSVIAGSLLSALPIVSSSGWYPPFGLLMFLAWRLLRSDPWPAWWAAALGLVNDLFTGDPIGSSVALWSAIMLALDLVDRRTMWRDYWVEWILAAMFLFLHGWVGLKLAAAVGADLPFSRMLPGFVIGVFCFPIAAWFVSRLDHWRLGR